MKPANPPHARAPAPEERAFRFQHGAVARSLVDLARELREAPPTVVGYHRAHFAPWLRDVVGDEPLARRFAHYADAGADPDALRDVLADLVDARLSELA